jgi:YD repeat-containing protein
MSFTDNNSNNFTFELAMSYSPSGNILSKSMDALTFQSGMGGAVAVNYDNTYTYNPSQPHAISNISDSNIDQQLDWDANGNLIQHTRTGANDIDRQLCWDEENRLTAVRDQNQLSAYIYDAGGERDWWRRRGGCGGSEQQNPVRQPVFSLQRTRLQQALLCGCRAC